MKDSLKFTPSWIAVSKYQRRIPDGIILRKESHMAQVVFVRSGPAVARRAGPSLIEKAFVVMFSKIPIKNIL